MLFKALLLLLCSNLILAEDPWSFLVLADWHGAETFSYKLGDDLAMDENYFVALKIFQDIREAHGGDLVILPGDTQTGHWHEEWYRKQFRKSTGIYGLTANETIAQAASNCHRTTKKLFLEAGFEQILVAIGDHEIGGNPWVGTNAKVQGLPHFRDNLVKHFNQDESGNFIFEKPIGSATSRPLDTPFAATSFAYVHKNALFITIDAFNRVGDQRYYDRAKGTGGEGIITCSVTGAHLAWFENVLIEANKDESIKHIFVQAHVPIVQPVRKADCSGQFFDEATSSPFWTTMRDYGVDVYFAGEVHANTATKDWSSNLLQVVSRANKINNFISLNITDDGFTISSYNEIGTEWRWNGNYEKHGEIKVDKSGLSTSIQSSGALEIVDERTGPLLRLDFEKTDTYPFYTRPILGMKHNQYKKLLNGYNITIRKKLSSTGMKNLGVFGQQYDAQVANLELTKSGRINGLTCGVFTEDTRVAFYSMGPMGAGEMISYSFYFKTTQADEMVLVHYGGSFGTSKAKDYYTLILKDGIPSLYFSKERYLVAEIDQGLNNNVWHHMRVSMSKKSCKYSEVEMVINGKQVDTTVHGRNSNIFFTTSGKVSLGGFGYSSPKFESIFPGVGNFVGMMDSFWLWSKVDTDSKLLIPSFRKRFEVNKNVRCKETEDRIFMGRYSRKKCFKYCVKNPSCWGYELRATTQGRDKCYHFEGERPELDSDSIFNNGDQCRPAVS